MIGQKYLPADNTSISGWCLDFSQLFLIAWEITPNQSSSMIGTDSQKVCEIITQGGYTTDPDYIMRTE